MNPRLAKQDAGFTLIEVCISSVLLSFLLILGVSMSRSANCVPWRSSSVSTRADEYRQITFGTATSVEPAKFRRKVSAFRASCW